MRKGNLVLLAAMLGLMLVVIGCGDGQETSADSAVTQSDQQVAETHDCDGGCGMTAVPMSKLTEIDSKFYCAGCVAKAKAEAEAEETTDEHKGHSHG